MAVVLGLVLAAVGSGADRVRAADAERAGPSTPALERAFERRLEALRRRDRVPGAAAALLHDGELVWEHAVGVADRASGVAVAADTRFQVASLSKPVTALGVLLLAADGAIDLDRPVWDSIRSWRPPASPYDWSGVTPRRLLSHRAGTGLHGYPGFPPERRLPTILESLDGETAGAGRVVLVTRPGESVRYSSGGYTLLQLLIEEVTGEPFAAYMDRRVLRPLGMTRSSFAPGEPTRLATGYSWWGRPLPAYRFREQAASGLLATAGDVARFLAVLSSPRAQEAVGIDRATIDTMLEPIAGGGYVLGFAIEPLPRVAGEAGRQGETLRVVSHTGANRGFRSILAASPERGDGFVVLTNSDRGMAMTTDLLCLWGRSTTRLELASCWAERKRRGTLLAVAGLIGLGLVMDGSAFARRHWRRRVEARPRWARAEPHAWAHWARLGTSLALLLGWWIFWYTDVVAVRREGIEHFVFASSMPPTFFWLTVVLTAWCLLGVARWLAALRARAEAREGG
jgi:CubicO group peptidase (beta-lactamase class C family)